MSNQKEFISIVAGITFLLMVGSMPVLAAQDTGQESVSPHGSHGEVEPGDHKKHPDAEEDSPHGSHGDVKPYAAHEEDSPHGSHGDATSGDH